MKTKTKMKKLDKLLLNLLKPLKDYLNKSIYNKNNLN